MVSPFRSVPLYGGVHWCDHSVAPTTRSVAASLVASIVLENFYLAVRISVAPDGTFRDVNRLAKAIVPYWGASIDKQCRRSIMNHAVISLTLV